MDRDLRRGCEVCLLQGGASPNAVSFYMRILRATYNRAVEKGIAAQLFPFKHISTRTEKTLKRVITTKGTICRLMLLNILCQLSQNKHNMVILKANNSLKS